MYKPDQRAFVVDPVVIRGNLTNNKRERGVAPPGFWGLVSLGTVRGTLFSPFQERWDIFANPFIKLQKPPIIGLRVMMLDLTKHVSSYGT